MYALQLLRWRCAECAIHHERNVREEQHSYTWREQAIIQWSWRVISFLLAATVWSFAHLPLGLSDRNIWKTSVGMKPPQSYVVSMVQVENPKTCYKNFIQSKTSTRALFLLLVSIVVFPWITLILNDQKSNDWRLGLLFQVGSQHSVVYSMSPLSREGPVNSPSSGVGG